MAQVFLSYDREDGVKAKAIAQALERAGHFVWWDLHIRGGAEYGKVIEQALAEADAIVVLWSTRSVDSAWVRDEAAAGRDKGVLIPVLLEAVSPPIGFRQYQNLDLSGWKGRGKPPRLQEMLSAIDSAGGGAPARSAVSPAPDPSPAPRAIRLKWMLGLAVALLAIAALLAWRPWSSHSLPLVSVEPADRSGPAKSLASDLFIKLGALQAADADALQLVEPGSNADPDFTFKVGAVAAAAGPQANLALVDGDGALLWSREFTQPGGSEADLRQQIAYSAGQVLRCATDALAPDHPELKPAVLTLYLKGCADLSSTSDTRMAIPAFRTVTQEAPRFAGGWAKLLIAELEAFKATGDRSLQQDMRRHVAEARKVDPELAEAYLVQSWLHPGRPIIGWMRLADEAVKRKPNNSAILENHALGLAHVGRLREAVEDARRAREIEPLSPGARQSLVALLADSGDLEAARRELEEAERLWPGASSILEARFGIEYRYGDPGRALSLLESGRLTFLPSAAQKSFLRARIDPTPSNIEQAIADARNAFKRQGELIQLIQTLAAFGRTDDVVTVLQRADPGMAAGAILVFFRPHFRELRRDRRFMAIAERFGLVDYWQSSGHWPDFCFEPDLPYDCKAEAAKLG